MSPFEFNLLPNVHKMRLLHLPHVDEYYFSTRSGSTGQGHTHECFVCDKTEDNKSEADIYDNECKTCGDPKPSARVRLATQHFTDINGNPIGLTILNMFGKKSGGKMKFTLSINTKKSTRRKPWIDNATGLTHVPVLTLTATHIVLTAGPLTAYMSRQEAEEGYLKKKLPNLCVTKTRSNFTDSKQHYNYYGFHSFTNMDTKAFWLAVEAGLITLEFRLKEGKDNGCSINMNLNRIHRLYNQMFSWDGPTDTITVLKASNKQNPIKTVFPLANACTVRRADSRTLKAYLK